MAICLDEPLPPETYEEIRNISDMHRALLVKLTR